MIPFIDLKAQQARIREKLDTAIADVLEQGQYIMGPQVRELESQLAAFCGAKHCLTCANGTDALQLALLALGVGEGDAVLVPSFTFAATAEVVPGLGATPVFVDIDPATYTMAPQSLSRAIAHAREIGLNPAAVIPVDLFGLPANYPAILDIAESEGLVVIGDSAQGFGARIGNRMTGTFGAITTTSFFPAKPLGCYGDGGALFTDDDDLAAILDSLRVHGKGSEKYDNVRIGMNSRLDTLQAAILLEKFAIYPDEIDARQSVADRYTAALAGRVTIPRVPPGYRSVWAQYTIRLEDETERAAVMARLKEAGVPSVVYYPRPLHTQGAYSHFPSDPQGLPESEAAAARVLSLPMHPYMTEADSALVTATITGQGKTP